LQIYAQCSNAPKTVNMADKRFEIICAENSGFCFGVRRAVNMLTELRKTTDKKIYTIGELIHNGIFVKRLEKDNIFVIEESDLESLAAQKDDVVLVVRTHGIKKSVKEFLDKNGFCYIDATCPFVDRIHGIVDENSKDAKAVVIMGDKNHPEVAGIMSYSHTDAYVCSGIEELTELVNNKLTNREDCILLTSQTTYNNEKNVNCQNFIRKLYTKAKIFDTICNVTEKRQNEVVSLSEKCDLMLVVGGKHSSNTKKLYEIASSKCKHTYLAEQADELPSKEIRTLFETFKPGKNTVFTVGITAGASTPDDILEEVKVRMSEIINSDETTKMQNTELNDNMSFEEMLDASFTMYRPGERVKGIVTRVTSNEVHVDLGIKYTGIVPFSEMTDDPSAKMEDLVKVGDEIEVIVEKFNDAEGTVLLSKKRIDADKNWIAFEEAEASGEVIDGKIIEVTRGGLVAVCQYGRVFIPTSQTTLPRSETPYEEKDLQPFMGQNVRFKIISTNKQRKRAVASMRAVVREEKAAGEAKFWETAEVGQKFTGKVKSITNYGAFVDLGPVDGMVHVSELSWKRIKNPSEVVNVGDEIDVFIKALDPEKKRISLGYKVEAENPWTILANNYHEGDVVDVKIVSLTPFGAFAEVIPGIDGLIHLSQISNQRIAKPADVLAVGDVVKVMITAIDFDAKRVSLSMRALLEPADEADYGTETEETAENTDAE